MISITGFLLEGRGLKNIPALLSPSICTYICQHRFPIATILYLGAPPSAWLTRVCHSYRNEGTHYHWPSTFFFFGICISHGRDHDSAHRYRSKVEIKMQGTSASFENNQRTTWLFYAQKLKGQTPGVNTNKEITSLNCGLHGTSPSYPQLVCFCAMDLFFFSFRPRVLRLSVKWPCT